MTQEIIKLTTLQVLTPILDRIFKEHNIIPLLSRSFRSKVVLTRYELRAEDFNLIRLVVPSSTCHFKKVCKNTYNFYGHVNINDTLLWNND